MTTLYRHEASAKRFLNVMVRHLRVKPNGGCYRLKVYTRFACDLWTHRDFFVGQSFGIR